MYLSLRDKQNKTKRQIVPVAQTAVVKLDLENILEKAMAGPLTNQKR